MSKTFESYIFQWARCALVCFSAHMCFSAHRFQWWLDCTPNLPYNFDCFPLTKIMYSSCTENIQTSLKILKQHAYGGELKAQNNTLIKLFGVTVSTFYYTNRTLWHREAKDSWNVTEQTLWLGKDVKMGQRDLATTQSKACGAHFSKYWTMSPQFIQKLGSRGYSVGNSIRFSALM